MLLPAKEPVVNVTHRKMSHPNWKWPWPNLELFCVEKWVNFPYLLNVVLNMEQYTSAVVT